MKKVNEQKCYKCSKFFNYNTIKYPCCDECHKFICESCWFCYCVDCYNYAICLRCYDKRTWNCRCLKNLESSDEIIK